MVHIDDIGTGNDKCFHWYNQPSQLLNINPKPHKIFTYQHTNNGKHTQHTAMGGGRERKKAAIYS